MEYQFKTRPFAHQETCWQQTRNLPYFAVFWEQGTGKTKLTIDTLGWLYMHKHVDALLVLAPNGVHRNWISDELPTHLPAEFAKQMRSYIYFSKTAKNVSEKREQTEILGHEGLAVVAMSYDALMTDHGAAFAKQFLTRRKCLYVLDEATRIKNPKAKRTQRVLASARYAPFRRILTGTPVANSPFDIYAQLKFLDDRCWNTLGIGSYTVFKAHFGIWEKKYNGQQGREFMQLVAYRNLNDLHGVVDKYGSRVTKVQVLDLPPKLYSKRYFQLTPEQSRLYKNLRENFMAEMEGGVQITAALAIVRLLRLQQITSNYLPSDDDNSELNQISEENPRIALLREVVDDIPHKFIVWAKFQKDIDLIMAALASDGIAAVQYDGRTSAQDRAKAIESFQRGDARAFVANPAAASEGLTLHAAQTVIYYNNSFKLTDRLQSEDRAHRIGQYHPVNYIDLVGEGTVDEHITKALGSKLSLASLVTGDKFKDWIG